MSVTAKLRSLSTPAKVALAVVALVLAGGLIATAWWIWGPGSAAGAGVSVLLAAFGLGASGRPNAEVEGDLADSNLARTEQDAVDATATARAAASERTAESAAASESAARSAGADDDGDPRRVLDRHSAGPGTRRKRPS